jgi:hypothetical protein
MLGPRRCSGVSLPYQLNEMRWCFNSLSQLDGEHRAIGVGVILQGDVEHADV